MRPFHGPHYRTRKRADFSTVLHTRELDESAYATKQMTTAKTVGAVSSEAAEWYAIDWQAIHQNVRRLQVRIVQATKAGRWNKVKSLQRLLTHSYSGKVLAVRRVTENTGKKTPGVDQAIWKTPEDKIRAVHALKSRGYQSQPLRRVYIPKSDGKTMRPLGIPCMIDRAQQALHLLALDPVLETNADRNSYGFVRKGPAPMPLDSASSRCPMHRTRSGFWKRTSKAVLIKSPMTGFWRRSLWTAPFSNNG